MSAVCIPIGHKGLEAISSNQFLHSGDITEGMLCIYHALYNWCLHITACIRHPNRTYRVIVFEPTYYTYYALLCKVNKAIS